MADWDSIRVTKKSEVLDKELANWKRQEKTGPDEDGKGAGCDDGVSLSHHLSTAV